MGVKEPEFRSQKQEARINVRIGELVLEGFPAGDRYRIAEGVKRELTRLLGEQGLGRLAVPSGNPPVVKAGAIHVGPGANAAGIGRQVAKSVHRAVTGGRGK